MWLRSVVLIAVAFLYGCANYRVVSAFGGETSKMTTVVRSEFDQLEALCVHQAELVIVVNNIKGDAPLDQCQRTKRAQSQYAALTVDVLDGYADSLGALADDKPFDVSPELRAVGSKVRALKDGTGSTVLSAKEADALTGVADLLVNALATVKRDEAVRRMVAATPDLTVIGKSLKSFFVQAADAPANAPKAPYANFIGVIASSSNSTQLLLDSTPMRKAEPIRTAELSRELRTRQKLLARRGPDGSDSVPAKVVAVIDAWLAALQKFSTDALKPDSQDMIDRLRALRDATRFARDAVADK